MSDPSTEFDDLSTAEQILHVQELWDRIAAKPDDVPVTPAQLDEIRRRLESHRENPEAGSSWEDVRDRLKTGSSGD
jgi:putative addiction module component (TIGR02574 family)